MNTVEYVNFLNVPEKKKQKKNDQEATKLLSIAIW